MTTLINGLTVDRTLTAQANWLALFNSANTHVFDGSEFTLGLPLAHAPDDPQEPTNTQITITAVPDTEFTGSKTLRYQRLTLGYTRAGSTQNYSLTSGMTQQAMINTIMADHNLVPSEITIDGTLPTTPGGTAVWTLTANPNSLLYTGQIGVAVYLPATP